MRIKYIFLIILVLSSVVIKAQSPNSIILEMIEKSNSLIGFTAEITKEERIKGELVKQVSNVKLIRNPFQIYLRQSFPKDGVEILLNGSDDKPLVNPNAFPWFNLSLDPYGSLMRKNQHHTIFDSGFDLMTSILQQELEKIGADTAKRIFFRGMVSWEERPAYHVEMINPAYGNKLYRVQMGEDLNSIAKKLNISEYAILELNKNIDFYDDVEPGEEIKIPSSYAKKMVLYIDKAYMLPLVIKVYDDNGLYEQYAYKKFKLNPSFAEGEFRSDYSEYSF